MCVTTVSTLFATASPTLHGNHKNPGRNPRDARRKRYTVSAQNPSDPHPEYPALRNRAKSARHARHWLAPAHRFTLSPLYFNTRPQNDILPILPHDPLKTPVSGTLGKIFAKTANPPTTHLAVLAVFPTHATSANLRSTRRK